jgi:hypothetical protein
MSQMNHPQMVGATQITDEDAVAAADKEMEERANRAKELLSQRHKGLRVQQVCALSKVSFCLALAVANKILPIVPFHRRLNSIERWCWNVK